MNRPSCGTCSVPNWLCTVLLRAKWNRFSGWMRQKFNPFSLSSVFFITRFILFQLWHIYFVKYNWTGDIWINITWRLAKIYCFENLNHSAETTAAFYRAWAFSQWIIQKCLKESEKRSKWPDDHSSQTSSIYSVNLKDRYHLRVMLVSRDSRKSMRTHTDTHIKEKSEMNL